MEIIGIISIWVLMFACFFYVLNLRSEKEHKNKIKIEFLYKHSHQFRETIKQEKINLWSNVSDKKLLTLIKNIESSPESQKEINLSVESSRKMQIWMDERAKKINYFAFLNLALLKEIKNLEIKPQEIEIILLINKLYPFTNTQLRIKELLSLDIIEKDNKGTYSVGFLLKNIEHPYELSENGQPKVINL
jgi:hypothetical protein